MGINVIYARHCKAFVFIKSNVISNSVMIEQKHKQIKKKQLELVKRKHLPLPKNWGKKTWTTLSKKTMSSTMSSKWVLIVTLFYLGDIDIYGPYFSFMSLQCHLCSRLCLGHEWHWQAINEKVRAINIDKPAKQRCCYIKPITLLYEYIKNCLFVAEIVDSN